MPSTKIESWAAFAGACRGDSIAAKSGTNCAVLGRRMAQLFAAVAFAELQDRERLRIYAVRHPSFAWTVPDLEERLRQSLARPWYEELAASWHAGGPTPQTPR